MRLSVVMVSLVALTLWGPAFAGDGKTYKGPKIKTTDRGFYMGASTGWTTVNVGFAKPTGAAAAVEESTGVKTYGGYQFNKYIGVEGYWADLGYANLMASVGSGFQFAGTTYSNLTAPVAMNIEADHYGAVVTAGLPIYFGKRRSHTLRPFGKIGLGVSRLTVKGNTGGLVLNVEERTYEGVFGLGTQLNLGESFAVQAEYELLPNSYGTSDFLSLGLQGRF